LQRKVFKNYANKVMRLEMTAKFLWESPEGRRLLLRDIHKQEDNIKIHL
jgi:hypothetical protein